MSKPKDFLSQFRPSTRKKLAGKVKAMRKQAKKTGIDQHAKMRGKLK